MFNNLPQNFIQLKSLSKNEASIIDLMESYAKISPETGYVIFQVIQNSPINGMKPINNAKITINKSIGNGYFVSKIVSTNMNGKTDPIALPTVEAYKSLSPDAEMSYSTYNATIEAPNFLTTDIYDIRIFDDITSLQTIQLLPGQSYGTHQIYTADPQNLCEEW